MQRFVMLYAIVHDYYSFVSSANSIDLFCSHIPSTSFLSKANLSTSSEGKTFKDGFNYIAYFS